MNIDLLVKLRELHDAVNAESTKVEAAKDVLREAQAKLAAFIEANRAELAELRAQLPGGEKPKRTRSDKGKPRGPRLAAVADAAA